MDVKTGELKNNLSKYLRHVRTSGQTVIIYDRNEPVAVLSPIARDLDSDWHRYREEVLARAKIAKVHIELPLRRPLRSAFPPGETTVAPDGRVDVNTIELERGVKDY